MDEAATTAVPRHSAAAALAQSVEHIIRNDGVTGSNPVSGTIPLRREIRNLKRKGLSAGSEFGSCLGGFGQRIGADPLQTHIKWANPTHLTFAALSR